MTVTNTQNAIHHAISKVSKRQDLTQQEAEAAMDMIMLGEATPAQIGGYLMALRVKGETVDEITGSARSMRRAANHPPLAVDNLIDTCGTGGDGAGSFNISTTVAFVVAGAGLPVAKHGNRAASSKSGSADVLAALGVNINLTPERVAEAIERLGIGFLFAPTFHPAMRHAIQPRRELGVRTIFNILGPLTNPAGARRQLLGVFSPELTETLALVLCELGGEAAFVVHGAGGLDELTTAGPNRVSQLHAGAVTSYVIDPQALGFDPADPEALRGGDPQFNAEITRSVLQGKQNGAARDVVLLNAAAALVAGGKAQGLAQAVPIAAESIDSGAAAAKLAALVEFSQRVSA
jgi:anthranilate phosphoribosyltransferase